MNHKVAHSFPQLKHMKQEELPESLKCKEEKKELQRKDEEEEKGGWDTN